MKILLVAVTLLLSINVKSKSLKIMQYNVENFFDTKFDQGTEDYTYLPLKIKKNLPGHQQFCEGINSDRFRKDCLNLDWTDEKFHKKILNISEVISNYDSSQKGPDIIVLQEIENLAVLDKLLKKKLHALGFKYRSLIEGDDKRGIDVGILSKYPIVYSRRHPIIMNNRTLDTRGILEVKIIFEDKTIVLFGNHWPSQSNPSSQRIASAQLLEKLASQTNADLVIAVGDFNTIDSEQPYPYDFLKSFIDAEERAREIRDDLHAGTYYFRGKWSSLDKIFIHEKSVINPDYRLFKIINHPFLLKNGFPHRFNYHTGEGYSDHLPIGFDLSFTE